MKKFGILKRINDGSLIVLNSFFDKDNRAFRFFMYKGELRKCLMLNKNIKEDREEFNNINKTDRSLDDLGDKEYSSII